MDELVEPTASESSTLLDGEYTNIPIRSDLPKGVNPALLLYSGEMTLKIEDDTIVGQGQVELKTQNGPRLEWSMTYTVGGFLHSNSAEGTLELSGYIGNRPCAKIMRLNGRLTIPSGEGSASGIVNGEQGFEEIVANDPTNPQSVDWVEFHVFNSRRLAGYPLHYQEKEDGRMRFRRDRSTLKFGEWEVVLEALPNADADLEGARDVEGFAITHVGTLRRTDRKRFPIGQVGKSGKNNARAVLEAVYWFLGFMNGKACGLLLPTGRRYDAPYVVWRQWSCYKSGRAGTSSGNLWLSNTIPVKDISTAADGFYQRWSDPESRNWLRRGVALYIASNQNSAGIEVSLNTSQTTLELLSWSAMMEVNQLMSESAFERLTAADRLRTLLFWMKVPKDIPARYAALKNAFGSDDGPKAVTDLRNWLIHPTKKNRDNIERVGWLAVADAWFLNLWYIELTLLRLINYEGPYNSRVGNPIGRIFSIVPWKELSTLELDNSD